jgi:hypothetical protein
MHLRNTSTCDWFLIKPLEDLFQVFHPKFILDDFLDLVITHAWCIVEELDEFPLEWSREDSGVRSYCLTEFDV